MANEKYRGPLFFSDLSFTWE